MASHKNIKGAEVRFSYDSNCRNGHRLSSFAFFVFLSFVFAVGPFSSAVAASNGRVITQVPEAAKERDLKLIDKFLKAVVNGNEAVARDMLDPFYSGTGGLGADRKINYSGDKIPRLKLFGNKKASVVSVYYHQDNVSKFKHKRYYFVIYKPDINHHYEVMKIELINNDNLFYMHNIWAPR